MLLELRLAVHKVSTPRSDKYDHVFELASPYDINISEKVLYSHDFIH